MERFLRFLLWVFAAIGMAVAALCMGYLITRIIGPAHL
jgi:hypothetical protein